MAFLKFSPEIFGGWRKIHRQLKKSKYRNKFIQNSISRELSIEKYIILHHKIQRHLNKTNPNYFPIKKFIELENKFYNFLNIDHDIKTKRDLKKIQYTIAKILKERSS